MKSDVIDLLYRKYYNDALLYTLSLCRNRDLAEDIVSTAFFKALQSADDDISNFKAWLLTVCRNEFYDYCRKHKYNSDEEIPEETASDEEDLSSKIIRQEEYRALYKAISLLPEQQREAVTLFYFSGLSVKEAAEIMGKTEANMKVILMRARENLKAKLEESL